jgi:Flp pilus assembly protein TadG
MRLSIHTPASPEIVAAAPSKKRQPDLRVRACSDEGQSLIEFALCLPLLLLIVTGILSFGITINNYIMLTDATNVGARQLAISRGQGTDPCATVASAIYAAAPVLTPAKFTLTFVLNGTSYSGASCSSTSSTTGAAGNLQQGTAAKVTAVYPCSLSVYGANFAPGCMLQAQTTELVQ